MLRLLVLTSLLFLNSLALAETPIEEFLRVEAVNEDEYFRIPNERITLQHIEFPIDHPSLYVFDHYPTWLTNGYGLGQHGFYLDFAAYLPTEVRNLILFEKDGKRYVRFFIHPEDRYYGERVKAYLRKRNIPYILKREYEAQRTASRSLIVFDHNSGKQFSYRPSTTQTLTDPRTRPNPIHWAYLSRRLSDYYKSMETRLQVLKIAYEGGAYGFPSTNIDGKSYGDITSQLRLVEEMSSGTNRHLSGFVMNNPDELARVAARAEMSVDDFLREVHYLLGKAQIELSFVLGFHYTSAHGQNFRIELTPEGKLTGRIVLLDLSDGRPSEDIFVRNGQEQLIRDWKRLANNTNPVIEGDGRGGVSTFTRVNSRVALEAMAEGAVDQLKSIGPFSESVLQSVRHYYMRLDVSEKGRTFTVPHLANYLGPHIRSCKNVFAQ